MLHPFNHTVNHCFSLTFDPNNPEVQGVEGILGAYLNSMQFVQLFGPTCFAPIINAAASCAAQSKAQGSQKYIVMLILTDGSLPFPSHPIRVLTLSRACRTGISSKTRVRQEQDVARRDATR
jgi:hypothetical protein